MKHEILLPLRVSNGDFEVARINGSTHGKFSVSFGPIYTFGNRLQTELEAVLAPKLEGRVHFIFEDYGGKLWADHEEVVAEAKEFWATSFEHKGKQIPAMPDRKAWTASRAWLMCRLHSAQEHFPEIFVQPSVDDMMRNIRMQRPSPHQRAFNRLHDTFGYPCTLRFVYETQFEVVVNEDLDGVVSSREPPVLRPSLPSDEGVDGPPDSDCRTQSRG